MLLQQNPDPLSLFEDGARLTSRSMHLIPRAFIRQPSGLRLDLLNPDPQGWTDEDLATGLSRTYRWGGYSVWPLPYSVAQHSLAVVALYHARVAKLGLAQPTGMQLLRELLHDADEALIGGFDAISPIKPILGDGYARIVEGLQRAVFARYGLTDWTPAEAQCHRYADHQAAASEAVHIAGWSGYEVLDLLNIGIKPMSRDPLAALYRCKAWKPWPPTVAGERFLAQLKNLQALRG